MKKNDCDWTGNSKKREEKREIARPEESQELNRGEP